MAAQRASGSVFAKLGERGRQAHAEAVTKPIEVGEGGLPPGIDGGVAQVIAIDFGEFSAGTNKGKPFFRATAIVEQPVEHAGLRTFLPNQFGEPLCDTATGKRKTFQEHYDFMVQSIGMLLGVQPGQTLDIGYDDVEPTCQQIVADGPRVRFRTWKGEPTKEFPNPRVNHVWEGLYTGAATAVDPGAGVADNGQPAGSQPPFDEFNQEPPPAQDEPQGETTWEDVAAQADVNDDNDADVLAARDQLIARCAELGINHEELDEQGGYVYPSWAAVAEAIAAAEAEPEPEPEPEPAPLPPKRTPPAKPAPKPAAAKAPAKPAPKAAAPARKPAAPAKKPAGKR